MINEPAAPPPARDRLRLIRDIATLQVKLLVDGFRDLLLVPASLAVGLLSLLCNGGRGDSSFYELLRFGKRSEEWINLFGAVERIDESGKDGSGEDIDRMVRRVESFLVDEYKHGHLSNQAREKIENSITRLRDVARRRADS